MEAKTLLSLRKQAETAVADMPDGDLKLKAFEVIFRHLLGGAQAETPPPAKEARVTVASPSTRREPKSSRSITGRILVLKDEGYFRSLRTISEVRQELQAHGWHYPLTTLSGPMQTLVQKRQLRRQKGKLGNKQIWKYSNY